jgi:hypothetical protein
VNPYLLYEGKEEQLKTQAADFSYAAAVKKTKKKKTANCTHDMEDLFKRMFDLDT